MKGLGGYGVDDSAEIALFQERLNDAIKHRVNSQDWCSWFGSFTVLSVDATNLLLEFPNEFAAKWVREHFLNTIFEAVNQVTNTNPSVQITTASKEASVGEAQPNNLLQDDKADGHTTIMTDTELRAELAATQFSSSSLDQLSLNSGKNTDKNTAFSTSRLRNLSFPDFIGDLSRLNRHYRFENFVVGTSNQLVHAAALSVAENPAQSYNPLFIYGNTGVGKTHLLHAIGNYVLERRPNSKIAYITTEQFVSYFVRVISESKASQAGRLARDHFKQFFRTVDLLLLEDVQFLAGKGSWLQEEIFHIFNELHSAGSQIIVSSDCSLEKIPRLEDRLRARFAWGLVAYMQPPDLATRHVVVRKKLNQLNLTATDEIIEFIARYPFVTIRELEGVLTQLSAVCSLSNLPLSLELVENALSSLAPKKASEVSIDTIQELVCHRFDIKKQDLLSQRRTKDLTLPRQIAMYLSRTILDAPSTQVAQRFNRKDHSTVLYAERQLSKRLTADPSLKKTVQDIVEQLERMSKGCVV